MCLKQPLKTSKLFIDQGPLWVQLSLAFYPSLPTQSKWALLACDCKVSFETSKGEQRLTYYISSPVWRPRTCLGERRLDERFMSNFFQTSLPQASLKLKTMLMSPCQISSGTRDNAFPQQSFPWTPSGRWVFSPLSFRSSVLPFAEQGDGRNKAGCKCYWVEIAPCAFLFSYLHSNVGTQVHQCIIICTFSVLDAVLQKSAPTHSSAHLQARLCFPLRVVRNTTNFRY